MAHRWDKKSASAAGKKSSRGADKVTAEMREHLSGCINIEKVRAAMNDLQGAEYIKATSMLLKYILPALSSVDLTTHEVSVPAFFKMTDEEQDDYLKMLGQ